MKLLFELSEEIISGLCLENESLVYAIPIDIDKDRFVTNSYLCVTQKRIITVFEGKVRDSIEFSSVRRIKSMQLVGCIAFVADINREEKILCRFSSRHLSRCAYVAKGAENLRVGDNTMPDASESEKVCLKCGRALPGTKECPHCSGRNTTLHNLWTLCLSYKYNLLVISLTMLAASLFSLFIPEVQKRFIDGTLTASTPAVTEVWADVRRFIVSMALLTALTIITTVAKNSMCVSMGARISLDLRKRMYNKIQELSLSFVDDRKPGELMNRITADTSTIRQFMQDSFGQLFSIIVRMICSIVLMVRINPMLTVMSVVFVPISFFISASVRKNVKRRTRLQLKKRDKLNSSLQDVLSGIRVVKSFGRENAETALFKKKAKEYTDVEISNLTFWAYLFPGVNFIMGIGLYFVTYFGGLSVLSGTGMTLGELTQFTAYVSLLYGPLDWMTRLPGTIVQMLTSLERIYDILGEQPGIADGEKAISHEIKGNVEFKNITFGYKSHQTVLENLSLSVKSGEMIGIVGASGAGKSTLINLIMRLYDVNSGEILFDGVNIKDIKKDRLHEQMGIVLQETFLFSGTVYQNIAFAKKGCKYEEVIRAAKMANAHDFIMKCPDGYNTYVGERGYNLSGGERQRIAIARAILCDPKLLILDEATSNLDTESEYMIQTAIRRLTKGKTTFAIAHRLSTLKDADRLIVIDGKNIAEMGTHNELMEKRGIYYSLVEAQLKMSELSK